MLLRDEHCLGPSKPSERVSRCPKCIAASIAPAFCIGDGVYVAVRLHVCKGYEMTVFIVNTFRFPNMNGPAIGLYYIAAA